MTAREQFEDRWENEQQTNPQPLENKEREYMIFLCGWEDGVRNYISEISRQRPTTAST